MDGKSLAEIGFTRHQRTGHIVEYGRQQVGRRPLFEDPEELIEAVFNYFQWCDANPLKEQKAFAYQGDVAIEELDKMRAPTLRGLCLFVGVSTSQWNRWRIEGKRPELNPVQEWAEEMIYEGKYTGAAAGLLNAGIVTRDLGLTDKSEVVSEVTNNDRSTAEDKHIAVHVHPDDPDPLDVPRPLYSLAQIEAGMPFIAPE